MDDALAPLLWGVFGVSIVVAFIAVLRWRREYQQSGWWTGIVVEGKAVEVGVDHDLCMGASSCVELAPEVFHLDWSKRKSMFDPAPLENTDGGGADPLKVFKAAQSCPYRAIYLRDGLSGERIFP